MDGGPSLESTARERAAVVYLAFGVDRPVDVEHALKELRGLPIEADVRLRTLRHLHPHLVGNLGFRMGAQ